MSQEPAAFLLDLSSQLFRRRGGPLDSGPAPFSCAWSVPVMSVLRDAELVSWSTDLVTGALVRLESLLGWGTELVGLEHRAG